MGKEASTTMEFSVCSKIGPRLDVQLVANLSDNFLKDILESDDPEHRFICIDDDRQVTARRAKKLHHCRQRRLLEKGQTRDGSSG